MLRTGSDIVLIQLHGYIAGQDTALHTHDEICQVLSITISGWLDETVALLLSGLLYVTTLICAPTTEYTTHAPLLGWHSKADMAT